MITSLGITELGPYGVPVSITVPSIIIDVPLNIFLATGIVSIICTAHGVMVIKTHTAATY